MAQIINFMDNGIAELIFRLKITSAIIIVIFICLIVFFFVKFRKLIEFKIQAAKLSLRISKSPSGGASKSRWEEVMSHIESDREAEWKFALIEADKLADDLLKKSGYLGDTMGERLMNIEKDQLLSLQGLWEAHKIRNKLVHDANYFLRYAEARQAIKLYEEAIRELQAI